MNHSLPESNPTALTPLQTPASRRGFLRRAGIAVAAVTAAPTAAMFLVDPSTSLAAATDMDLDILNFALNLEYLESEFYSLAFYGKSIEDQFGVDTEGAQGPAGQLIIKPNFASVPFVNKIVEAHAKEITDDEVNHVTFLRSVLGSAAISRPDIDLYNSFNGLANLAGLGDMFDPFASDLNFLVGGFIFEDVGVTAYHGAAPLITSKTYLAASAGILAVEAYHAAILRTNLYSMAENSDDPTVIFNLVQKISDVRDSVDGPSDKDQGIVDDTGDANIVPTDASGLAYARSAKKVLNIVYGAHANFGAFFPSGVNGAIHKG